MDSMANADVEAGLIDMEGTEENKNVNNPPLGSSSITGMQSSSSTTDAKEKTAESMPLEFKKRFYPGDIVVVKEDRNVENWVPYFGTVLKPTFGSDSDDKGATNEFHVHWDLTNRITMTKGLEVALVDRSLFRGQKVENQNGDIGIITGYETTVSVQINGTNDVVENVPIHRLRPISPHVRGQDVFLNGWVGVITGIKRNVWFRADGGPIFYLEAFERDGFAKTDPFWGLGTVCPGIRTRLSSSVLKKAKWATSASRFFSRLLPLHYLYSWMFSTIIRTEVTEMEVKWLQVAPGIPNPESVSPPNELVSCADLHKLLVVGTPSSETIGIGSVRKMAIFPQDEISKYTSWLEGFKKRFIEECTYFKYQKTKAMFVQSALKDLAGKSDQETPVRVLLRHNVVSVEWQNGVKEKIPSVDIVKISTPVDDGEFPAGLTVAPLQKDASNGDRYGIVMDSSELTKSRSRKIKVQWIVDGKDSGVREESVFDIKPHNSYSLYHRGTILFPRDVSAAPRFKSAVVVDVNIPQGKMVVIKSSDNQQDEVLPHEVIALTKRCHWSFFTRKWTVDDMIPPPYQLHLEFDPANRLVDVSEQKLNVLDEDPNNPQEGTSEPFPTIWDEPPFELLGFAPNTHRYYTSSSSATFGKGFAQMIEKEIGFLRQKENVTEGIWIRSYENRMDLMSVLMVGPSKTPYEDGLYLFDMQLHADFPSSRPAIHYISYTLEIHPLLSYDGNVCVSSIPWNFGEDEETPSSYIMHFLDKLQALLFTPTPYFASVQKKPEENSEHGRIKSELYNQGLFVRVLDSIWNMLQSPHEPWEKSIRNHFISALPDKLQGIQKWMSGECLEAPYDSPDEDLPSCPPISIPDGLRIAVNSRVKAFKKLLKQTTLVEIHSVTDTTADSESHSVEQQKAASVVSADSTRRLALTPISELTEPSSTSTFGNKLSNLSVSSHDQEDKMDNPPVASLDSMKNIKQNTKGIEKSKSVDIAEVGSDIEGNQENENKAVVN